MKRLALRFLAAIFFLLLAYVSVRGLQALGQRRVASLPPTDVHYGDPDRGTWYYYGNNVWEWKPN